MLYISDEFTIKLGLTCTATRLRTNTALWTEERSYNLIYLHKVFMKVVVYRENIIAVIAIYIYTMR